MEGLNELLKHKSIKDKKISYTVILHQSRERLGISIAEYCVADIIYHYGGLQKSREMGGWCYASKQQIAACLGLGKKTVDRAINKLIRLDLIEKNPDTRHLRTTGKWYNEVVSYKSGIKKKTAIGSK